MEVFMLYLIQSILLFAEVTSAVHADAYPSLHAAVDANPGRVIQLSDRDYAIDRSLIITADRTALVGPGRVVMSQQSDSIVRIEEADDVRIEGVTLTRAEGKEETTEDGLRATACRGLTVRFVKVVNNHSPSASIRGHRLDEARIEGCDITNYKAIGVEDRTDNAEYGFAFKAILGDGITLTESQYVTITNNRIVEERLVADEETMREHKLGTLTEGRKSLKKGRLAPAGDYTPLWHQGSAIVVTSPEVTRHIVITGNDIINAAQGVDIHADQVIFSSNAIDRALIGIKSMHGSRNVVITGNNVSRVSLWGLLMMAGSSTHEVQEQATPPREANVTAGNIITSNVFSGIGYGPDWHNWAASGSCRAITIDIEDGDDPPTRDVIIANNLVYDDDADGKLERGKKVVAGPRYEYALTIDTRLDLKRFRIIGNIFPPGKQGISNIPLENLK
jgi:hypothetical protein